MSFYPTDNQTIYINYSLLMHYKTGLQVLRGLTIEVRGTKLIVHSGSCNIGGTNYTLLNDIVFELQYRFGAFIIVLVINRTPIITNLALSPPEGELSEISPDEGGIRLINPSSMLEVSNLPRDWHSLGVYPLAYYEDTTLTYFPQRKSFSYVLIEPDTSIIASIDAPHFSVISVSGVLVKGNNSRFLISFSAVQGVGVISGLLSNTTINIGGEVTTTTTASTTVDIDWGIYAEGCAYRAEFRKIGTKLLVQVYITWDTGVQNDIHGSLEFGDTHNGNGILGNYGIANITVGDNIAPHSTLGVVIT